MHIHFNQSNPNAQFQAAYAAQQAEARREAAAVRKKLTEFASKLAAAADEGIWSKDSDQGNPDRQSREGEQQEKERGQDKQGGVANRISDWG